MLTRHEALRKISGCHAWDGKPTIRQNLDSVSVCSGRCLEDVAG